MLDFDFHKAVLLFSLGHLSRNNKLAKINPYILHTTGFYNRLACPKAIKCCPVFSFFFITTLHWNPWSQNKANFFKPKTSKHKKIVLFQHFEKKKATRLVLKPFFIHLLVTSIPLRIWQPSIEMNNIVKSSHRV
jgi:hypothetical protein